MDIDKAIGGGGILFFWQNVGKGGSATTAHFNHAHAYVWSIDININKDFIRDRLPSFIFDGLQDVQPSWCIIKRTVPLQVSLVVSETVNKNKGSKLTFLTNFVKGLVKKMSLPHHKV